MNLHITKSKNAESFYICKSYTKANGSTTSAIVRKLGTLKCRVLLYLQILYKSKWQYYLSHCPQIRNLRTTFT